MLITVLLLINKNGVGDVLDLFQCLPTKMRAIITGRGVKSLRFKGIHASVLSLRSCMNVISITEFLKNPYFTPVAHATTGRPSQQYRSLGCEVHKQNLERKENNCRKPDDVQDFANEWVKAWNSHDLDRVMSHYANDFEITTPFIKVFMGAQAGDTLKGKKAVGQYWSAALSRVPDLKFELIDVAEGAASVTLYYRSINNKKGMEVMFFDNEGKISKVIAHYTA